MRDLMHKAEIQQLVRDAYAAIQFPAAAGAVLYSREQLGQLPPGAHEWSLGVGNPVAWAALRPGEVVLDLGCGGGIDTILAARAVHPGGRAVGLDLLPEMLQRAGEHAADAGLDNVEFIEGEMEAIPLPDATVDVVVSNGVVNLSARKTRVFHELARVLRSGGRTSLTDVIVDDHLPTEILTHPSAWAG
ncbi:MAG TPA: methyltransferase domain-containing protein [Egibacteraceae bacterium]|nr:methyltransferase domain-containing protein [Actinomycetota bacterium]HWB71562.1 methyltransferase domain-containing protein [Egibacteraceae bacterium]